MRGRGQDYLYENYAKPRAPRRYLESQFQRQVAAYLTKALPPEFLFTAFPAGRHLGPKVGARLKAEGLKAGMPDLVIFGDLLSEQAPAGQILWLELKTKVGRISGDQMATHKILRNLGHQVAICRTLPEVEAAVAEFIFPSRLKARVRV